MLLKHPDGCKRAQKLLDTVWGPDGMNTLSGRMMLVCLAFGWDDTSSGRMKQRTDGHPDGMARSSGRLTGNLNLCLQHLYTLSYFVQTQNEAKILTGLLQQHLLKIGA
jgi:hypothetical protein